MDTVMGTVTAPLTANASARTSASALLAEVHAPALSHTGIRKRAQAAERRRPFAVTSELRVCVVGLGYIGLPTASLLGTKGAQVHGVDISPAVVDTINQGRIHIEEPDLDLMVKSAVQGGRLKAGLVPVEADVFVLAVPTPIQADKSPDMQLVRQAVRSIAPFVRPGNLVILESTSPVGTTDEIVSAILAEAGHAVGDRVFVAYCPERVLPGRILTELV